MNEGSRKRCGMEVEGREQWVRRTKRIFVTASFCSLLVPESARERRCEDERGGGSEGRKEK
jgi:hypothetical protein